MNRRIELGLVLAVWLTAFLIAAAGVLTAHAGTTRTHSKFVSISLSSLHLETGERVVGFEFAIKSGRIARIRDFPIGWNIVIDNDPSWNTKLNGSVLVAAAALDGSFFRDFLVIEKASGADSPFGLKGAVVVSTDFSKTRKIPVSMKDFTILDEARSSKKGNPN